MSETPDSSPCPDPRPYLRDLVDVLSHELHQPIGRARAAVDVAWAGVSSLIDAGTSMHAAEQADRLARTQAMLAQGHQALHAAHAHIDNTLAVASLLLADGPVCMQDHEVDLMVALAIADMPPQQATRIRIERLTATRTALMASHLMRLALRNLLSNALKFSPPDTPVVVRLQDSDKPLALLIDVVDQGPGMAHDLAPDVFAQRSRHAGPDAAEGGARRRTLGLHIVRQAMLYQGGAVELVGTGPQGSTLRLVLVQG